MITKKTKKMKAQSFFIAADGETIEHVSTCFVAI